MTRSSGLIESNVNILKFEELIEHIKAHSVGYKFLK